jgi:hypothetical protein
MLLPRPSFLFSPILLFSLAGALPAAAQGNPTIAGDRAALSACLRDSRSQPSSCVGGIAVSCVRAATGDRRAAEFGCARREEAAWRERLTAAMQQSGRGFDAGQRSRLAALHVTWEGYIAQKCAFYGASQSAGLQAGRQAGCELREVAMRALELQRGLPGQGAQRRPTQPPRIIR